MDMRPIDGETIVAKWMRELAATPLAGPPLVDPQVLLWKAQASRRLDRQQQITRPLDTGERIQTVAGATASVALMVWLSATVPLWTVPSFVVVILVSSVLLIAAGALMVWDVRQLSRQ